MANPTAEQALEIERVGTQWVAPFTTQADHERQEAAIKRLYRFARLPVPKLFVWFGNGEAFHAADKALKALSDQSMRGDAAEQNAYDGLPESVKSISHRFHSRVGNLISTRTYEVWGTSYYTPDFFSGLDYTQRRYYDSIVHKTLESFSLPENSNRATFCQTIEYGFRGIFDSHRAAQRSMWLEVARQTERLLDPQHVDALEAWGETIRCGGLWQPYEGGVLLCENPTVLKFNGDGRLNNIDGTAAEYADGTKMYFIAGVNVPEALIMDPPSITVEQILGQQNTEIRRIMIEKMGVATFLQRVDASLVNADPVHGKLWSTEILRDDTYFSRPSDRNGWARREVVRPATFLEVQNSTPEPDGTYRTFFLRVPSRFRTAHGARAWTLRTTKREFTLVKET